MLQVIHQAGVAAGRARSEREGQRLGGGPELPDREKHDIWEASACDSPKTC
jgi:hypothetical protein